uniref:Uncharacterized protein n=1 Tax=Prymnesium polylepis TaxID=72548 RepID=A0A7S4HWZ1_9EUKA
MWGSTILGTARSHRTGVSVRAPSRATRSVGAKAALLATAAEHCGAIARPVVDAPALGAVRVGVRRRRVRDVVADGVSKLRGARLEIVVDVERHEIVERHAIGGRRA